MSRQRNWLRTAGGGLVGVLAGVLFLALLLPELYAELLANVERVQALRGLDLPVHERSLDEAAWDAGWRSLCSPGEVPALASIPASERALEFSALASIDRGDYATAQTILQRLADRDLADDEPNALAYKAALDMDWLAAARAYRPQSVPRHDRWWGTVFYLAAQQQMFRGASADAADLYRRADAAYGMHGPYLGLGLVECLAQRNRPLEAWDAYRRALSVLPPEEALEHLDRFEALRLEALRAWHGLDPANVRVGGWLAFYEGEAQREPVEPEALRVEPEPQVLLEMDLGDGRALLGFDYRVEDLETGPFMTIDFYLREGQAEQVRFWRVRKTVLNQAPNGAFAWDAVPDGVRPVGWHGFVYSHDLAALSREEVTPGAVWLCLDAGRIGTSFGLQGDTAPIADGPGPYIQGGKVFPVMDAYLTLGRTWFGVEDPHNYSFLSARFRPSEVKLMVGTWEPVDGADSAAVWLMAHHTSKGCFQELYLFSAPDFTSIAWE